MWQVPSHKIKVLKCMQNWTPTGSRDDAVLTEMENSDLRTACGDDAPRWREKLFEKVLTPCLDSNSVLDRMRESTWIKTSLLPLHAGGESTIVPRIGHEQPFHTMIEYHQVSAGPTS